MKKFFSKLAGGFQKFSSALKTVTDKIPKPKFFAKLMESEKIQKFSRWCNEYSLIEHIPLSLMATLTFFPLQKKNSLFVFIIIFVTSLKQCSEKNQMKFI